MGVISQVNEQGRRKKSVIAWKNRFSTVINKTFMGNGYSFAG